eukprot:6199364-Pleurochrysis_carterae.AAC.1
MVYARIARPSASTFQTALGVPARNNDEITAMLLHSVRIHLLLLPVSCQPRSPLTTFRIESTSPIVCQVRTVSELSVAFVEAM